MKFLVNTYGLMQLDGLRTEWLEEFSW